MSEVKFHKRKALIRKHSSYHRRAMNYNNKFKPDILIPDPSLAEVEGMDICDLFWSGGSLSHPDEPWASDVATREGIQAYLLQRASEEELRRIAREARQLTQWAVMYQSRLDSFEVIAGDGKSSDFLLTVMSTCPVDGLVLTYCLANKHSKSNQRSPFRSISPSRSAVVQLAKWTGGCHF